jgi:Domain of unknown function (DUF222)
MPSGAVAHAHRLLTEAVQALAEATAVGATTDAELLSALTVSEGTSRRLDRLMVDTVAVLQRRGAFAERGYKSTAGALSDLLGWERFEARRLVNAADHVSPRIGLDGTELPPLLPATAAAFAAGGVGIRHVDVIAKLLNSPSARRLDPDAWAGAEAVLAEKAGDYTPTQLQSWGAS